MEDVDRRIRGLDSRLDDLESEHESLGRKFGYTEDLDHELGSIRSDVRSCEGKLEELDGELRDRVSDTERTINRLVEQVRLLEGQLLASGGVQLADLDTFSKDQRALARSRERGRQARSTLLSDHDRTTFQIRLRHRRETAGELRAHRTTVVDAVGTLLATRYGSRSRAEAADKLGQALVGERGLRQGLDRESRLAEEAESALAVDATTRAEKQSVIAAGAKAEQRLTLGLRSRLADAVRERALLPAWFVTVLGSAPPARSTQKWLETATEVLLYRLTYDITDQVVALGEKPSDTAERRRAWYEKLRKDLQRW
ncbi:hypothetical protein ABZ402_48420 [Streptomyces mirabilis]|uniref:hypothetical protein n=1 Tax=Streptomyces mirabilis TaxID=68239 RepID=UPI0033F65A94